MIALSGALVLVIPAFGVLGAGIATGQLGLVYVSIGVSLVSLVLLGIGIVARRGEIFSGDGSDSTDSADSARSDPALDRPGAAAPAPVEPAFQAQPVRAESVSTDTTASFQIPDDAVVFVTPGRGHYHLEACRQLKGRASNPVRYTEARRHYRPCTACLPDTALAARARSEA